MRPLLKIIAYTHQEFHIPIHTPFSIDDAITQSISELFITLQFPFDVDSAEISNFIESKEFQAYKDVYWNHTEKFMSLLADMLNPENELEFNKDLLQSHLQTVLLQKQEFFDFSDEKNKSAFLISTPFLQKGSNYAIIEKLLEKTQALASAQIQMCKLEFDHKIRDMTRQIEASAKLRVNAKQLSALDIEFIGTSILLASKIFEALITDKENLFLSTITGTVTLGSGIQPLHKMHKTKFNGIFSSKIDTARFLGTLSRLTSGLSESVVKLFASLALDASKEQLNNINLASFISKTFALSAIAAADVFTVYDYLQKRDKPLSELMKGGFPTFINRKTVPLPIIEDEQDQLIHNIVPTEANQNPLDSNLANALALDILNSDDESSDAEEKVEHIETRRKSSVKSEQHVAHKREEMAMRIRVYRSLVLLTIISFSLLKESPPTQIIIALFIGVLTSRLDKHLSYIKGYLDAESGTRANSLSRPLTAGSISSAELNEDDRSQLERTTTGLKLKHRTTISRATSFLDTGAATLQRTLSRQGSRSFAGSPQGSQWASPRQSAFVKPTHLPVMPIIESGGSSPASSAGTKTHSPAKHPHIPGSIHED